MKQLQTPEGLYKDLTYQILGAAMRVHSVLGCGHPEEIYQKALEEEFRISKIPYEPQKAVTILYKDIQVGLRYLDFVMDDKIILEIKSVNNLNSEHEFQVLSYFAATSYLVALLINFGKSKLEYKRLLPSKKILENRVKKNSQQM